MPTDYGDTDSLENDMATCSYLETLIAESDSSHFSIIGDMNCDVSSRFYRSLNQLAVENQLIFTDVIKLHNAVTYYSDDGSKQSWINHVICTGVIDNLVLSGINELHLFLVLSIFVLNDVISSDHRPISFEFNCNFATYIPEETVLREPACAVNWNNLSDSVITKYQNALDTLLKDTEVHTLNSNLYDIEHSKPVIDQYYGKIMMCLRTAALSIMNCKRVSDVRNNVIVSGWNDLVKKKHSIAIDRLFMIGILLANRSMVLCFMKCVVHVLNLKELFDTVNK